MALVGAILFLPLAALAGDPYAADPLRLVPFADTVQRVYTGGVDRWEVWLCNVPDWDPVTTLSQATAGLEANLEPYFSALSGGDYAIDFVAGGNVSSADAIPTTLTTPERFSAPGCEAEVSRRTTTKPNAVLIVINAGFDGGYATAGAVCPEAPFTGCATDYPANYRRAVIGGAAVTTIAPRTSPQWITAAHEIGHALNWAHDYSGLTTDPATGLVSVYDNPMDVMSAGAIFGAPIGTIAYNRYAAGWVDPAAVAFHTSGIAIYTLGTIGAPTEMIVLPGIQEGHFYFLDARRRFGLDTGLPTSGVEVYEVDQRRELACGIPPEWPQTWPCFATLIRIKPVGATAGLTSTTHVLGIDDSARVGRFSVKVLGADTASFSVRISEIDSGRFIDDDGNIYEPSIETIAALGITLGCNPPTNDRYCPAGLTSRAEAAAFLVRALGESVEGRTYRGYFPDVTADQWYAPYVERLFELGIITGYDDGTFRPADTVSRAEMAAFLIRSFDTGIVVPDAGDFADVSPTDWFAVYAERLLDLGISKGCAVDPLRYCPGSPVRRDEMAGFLARSLAL